jgi:hypothetical protein
MSAEHETIPGLMRTDVVYDVLVAIRCDEARAILLLITILRTLCAPGPQLDQVCAIIEQWQHVPPARLVAALQSLRKELAQ